MATSYDETLLIRVQELQEALNGIPHGIAKQLEEPIQNVLMEAYWLNSQRDQARQALAETGDTL